jgi:hypothetical protein
VAEKLALGRSVKLRKGRAVIETIDSIRLDHLMAFARATGKPWPTLEWLAQHLEGDADIDATALLDELQRLAQERPPENLAPMIGLLRNDAVRVSNLAVHA